jgi:hypothetical protein
MKRSERWWLRLHPLTRQIDRRVPVEWVVKRATVSNAHRYCYFRIPKCANSTVIKTLARHDPALAVAPEAVTLDRLKHEAGGLFRARAWSPHSLARRYFCFTVARNPHARLLSAYLDKIAAADAGHYQYVARVAGKSDVTAVTFDDFVGFLERGGLYANAHWAPQGALLPVAVAALAFVARVEQLDADLGPLMQRIGIGANYTGTFLREERRRHSENHLGEYYTRELADRVARLYAEDFDQFGYATDLSLPDAFA